MNTEEYAVLFINNKYITTFNKKQEKKTKETKQNKNKIHNKQLIMFEYS